MAKKASKFTKSQRAAISQRMKALWEKRRNGKSKTPKRRAKTKRVKTLAALATAATPVVADPKPRWLLTVLAHDPSGTMDYSQYQVDQFGEMVDILHNAYLGVPIERFWVEKNPQA